MADFEEARFILSLYCQMLMLVCENRVNPDLFHLFKKKKVKRLAIGAEKLENTTGKQEYEKNPLPFYLLSDGPKNRTTSKTKMLPVKKNSGKKKTRTKREEGQSDSYSRMIFADSFRYFCDSPICVIWFPLTSATSYENAAKEYCMRERANGDDKKNGTNKYEHIQFLNNIKIDYFDVYDKIEYIYNCKADLTFFNSECTTLFNLLLYKIFQPRSTEKFAHLISKTR
uniref:Uncharacterized protein n=1 Tax=Romanomermis culicivorax TaxID=13658 RepID=A0A915KG78_ROMCU